MGNKYNKVLRIVIIVSGILIIALFIALGINIYNRYLAAKEQAQASENDDDYLSKRRRTTNDIDGLNVDTESQTNSTNLQRPRAKNGTIISGYIEIPAISLKPAKMPILIEFNQQNIEIAPCMTYGNDCINVPGINAVIEGHNYKDGTHFSNISHLQTGDIIYVTDTRLDSGARIKYAVYNIYETAAEDKEQALFRSIPADKREITLSTCYGDNNDSRTIVWAREAEDQPTE